MEKEDIDMKKIIDLLANSEDDGTFLDTIYDLYVFIGIAKGIGDVREGKGMSVEESKRRLISKYEGYNTRYGS